jgi:hypothetical protein
VQTKRLELSRDQILAFRRRVGALDERLPMSPASLRRAAWAGLQDSMPRAALLSIHARVQDTTPETLFHESLVQVWGPRYSAFVVPLVDLPLFTLGRMPDDAKGQERARRAAATLRAHLGRGKGGYGAAGQALGVNPNSLRYGATTGEVVMRWEGARQPRVWMVAPPTMDASAARLELARRYLHVYGPASPTSFADWAGIASRAGDAAFERLGAELTPVTTPIGDAWILKADEHDFRRPASQPAPARLLPSGDSYFLLQGRDRELLVEDAKRRPELWTSRVWPGALLVNGEVAGVWRRANEKVTVETWRRLITTEKEAVEAEAKGLPLPGLTRPIALVWSEVGR